MMKRPQILRYLAFSLFVLFILPGVALAAFPPSPEARHQKWFHESLISAFNRVLAPGIHRRLAGDIKRTNIPDLKYVLTSQNIFTLEAFVALMSRKLEGKKNDRNEFKLSPQESAALLLFYLSLDPKTNSLIKNQMLRKSDARLADSLRSLTRWPYVPIRKHGLDLPKVPYNPDEWKKAARPFVMLKLEFEFLVLRSQFVNPEAAHLTHRHILGFDDKFFEHLQRVAVQKGEPQIAKRAFLAYLATTKTEPVIDRLEKADALAVGDLPGLDLRTIDSTAEFAYAVSKFDREQLLRFFSHGITPRGMAVPDSPLVRLAVEYFLEHPMPIEATPPTAVCANKLAQL